MPAAHMEHRAGGTPHARYSVVSDMLWQGLPAPTAPPMAPVHSPQRPVLDSATQSTQSKCNENVVVVNCMPRQHVTSSTGDLAAHLQLLDLQLQRPPLVLRSLRPLGLRCCPLGGALRLLPPHPRLRLGGSQRVAARLQGSFRLCEGLLLAVCSQPVSQSVGRPSLSIGCSMVSVVSVVCRVPAGQSDSSSQGWLRAAQDGAPWVPNVLEFLQDSSRTNQDMAEEQGGPQGTCNSDTIL
jgi:hypothetical protein